MQAIRVAAGILRRADRRVLICERVDGGPFKGMWEFPGGKIALGESAREALTRELAEEIGVDVVHCRAFLSLRHDYPDRSVAIDFYLVDSWRRNARGREGQRLRWVRIEDLDQFDLLPADGPVIEALKRL